MSLPPIQVNSRLVQPLVWKMPTKNSIIEAFEPELDYEIAILSSPDIAKSGKYKITVGSLSNELISN